jgi:hypothetical protein
MHGHDDGVQGNNRTTISSTILRMLMMMMLIFVDVYGIDPMMAMIEKQYMNFK